MFFSGIVSSITAYSLKLKFTVLERNHAAFGDVEKLVKTTLVRTHYLEFIKDKHGPSCFRYES